MPRGQSNRGGSRSGSSRGGRQNISSRSNFRAMDEDKQRKISAKGGRASGGGRKGRHSPEDSDRSE